MAPTTHDTLPAPLSQEDFQTMLQAEMHHAIRLALMAVLDEEVTTLIGAAPYERSPLRRDQRNGSYTRDLDTSAGRIEDLEVPRTRGGFQTRVFDRYQRRRREVDSSLREMFIQGVSTAQVGTVLEHLNGTKPSPSLVSRVFHKLEDEFETWKKRPLAERYVYCFADGTYFSVIYDHEGCKMPILAVIGICLDGKREVLGFSVGDRENQGAWEQLLEDLMARGVRRIDLWITDVNRATINAIEAKFPTAARQRCIKHKLENVLSYIPQKQRDQVEPEIKAIFYQDSRAQADQAAAAFCAKYEKIYGTAVDCLQRDLESCLTFYAFPRAHWKTIRTTNVVERLFEEVKKRSHKMNAAFRNEDSCLLMFYAVIRGMHFKTVRMPN